MEVPRLILRGDQNAIDIPKVREKKKRERERERERKGGRKMKRGEHDCELCCGNEKTYISVRVGGTQSKQSIPWYAIL